jgi:hypothetical protein
MLVQDSELRFPMLIENKVKCVSTILHTMWQELQLDITYFQRRQRQEFENIFQIILTVCSHVKLQEFKAAEEMRRLFVRTAWPHVFIYIAALGCDGGLRLKV